MELVGVKCFSEAKDGMDAGVISGVGPIGVTATRVANKLIAMDADCVIFCAKDAAMSDPLPGTEGYESLLTICRLLESGKNVVSSTSMQPNFCKHMGKAGPELIDMLEASCRKGRTSVFFTGMEPRFIGVRTTGVRAFHGLGTRASTAEWSRRRNRIKEYGSRA